MINHLEKAYEARQPLFREMNENATTCYRFFSGEREGISGLVIEVLGTVAVFQVFEGQCSLGEKALQELAEWCLNKLSLQAVYLKKFISDRSHAKEDPSLKDSTPFVGEKCTEEITVLENGVSYLIRPYDGYSVGLFLDQRNNRKKIAELSQGKRVLNLFSYTCGFSTACAKMGAEVTSVDVSKKYLEWGKRNFAANGLSLEGQTFIASDAVEYLRRIQKKGTKFDVVVLDPPSFGRSANGVFSLKNDWKDLLIQTLSVVENGVLFFSSNLTLWDEIQFRRNVAGKLQEQGRKFSEIQIKKPLDFSFEVQGLNQICLKI